MVVTAAARLRPSRDGAASPHSQMRPTAGPAPFAFADLRKDPLRTDVFCLDILAYRASAGLAELSRLDLRAAHSHPRTSPVAPGQRRASALTEMMRAKAGLVSGTNLEVTKSVMARWALLTGAESDEELVIPTAPHTHRCGTTVRER